MKAKALRDLTAEELEQHLADTKAELFKAKHQKAAGQNEKPIQIRTLRRQIARTLTVMRAARGAKAQEVKA